MLLTLKTARGISDRRVTLAGGSARCAHCFDDAHRRPALDRGAYLRESNERSTTNRFDFCMGISMSGIILPFLLTVPDDGGSSE